jgi:hypothetical protein
MQVEKLIPANDLESLLSASQAGKRSLDDFLGVLVSSELFVVSVKDVPPGSSGINPLLFDRAGTPMAAVFTDASRVSLYKKQVKSVIRMVGCEMFRNVPHGYGIVINPGFDIGLELLPEGIKNVLGRYCD